MSGGYMHHPNSTESFRERSGSCPVGITNHGWQCRQCLKRTAIVEGRKRAPFSKGWICAECACEMTSQAVREAAESIVRELKK